MIACVLAAIAVVVLAIFAAVYAYGGRALKPYDDRDPPTGGPLFDREHDR